MPITLPNWKSRTGLAIIILVFMAVALLLRLIPALFIKDTGFLYPMDTDTWYTLRQVEVMVNHFPQYDWFDPMTAFPTGKIIDWGPLFAFLTAVLCLLTGATTPSGIIYVSSWVSPLMAALMVPVTYFIGKTIWDGKAGIVAAGLISVVSLAYFSLTTFGRVIHHIGEVLFSSLFFLVYLYYLTSVKCRMSDIKNIKTLLVPVALASLAGVLYFFALLTSTTTLLVLAVIAIFTLVQNIVDHLSSRPSGHLLVLNLVFLSVTTILLVLFGFKQPGLSVTSYTIGLVYVNLALIAETIVLYGISSLFRGKIKPYLICLGALAVAGVAVLQVYLPLRVISQQGLNLLFSSANFSVGVINTVPLSLDLAWQYFNVALLLAAGGFLVLCYHIAKKRNAEWIFLLIWSAFMLLVTVQYQRFIYFSTVNIVLLSAICIIEPFTWKKTDGTALSLGTLTSSIFSHRTSADDHGDGHGDKPSRSPKTNKSRRINKPSRNLEIRTDQMKVFCMGAVIILGIVLVAVSVYNDADLALTTPNREIPSDWVESLNWLKTNTPSPGVDYFQQYSASTFSYPPGAYGILAEWSAGHWITFFAHRIPITNPFQDHLDGSSGAYAFFLSQNESQADDILGEFGGRYVITDSSLAVDNIRDLVLWGTNSVDISPYITQFMVPGINNPSNVSIEYAYNDAYFRTMIIRLYSFDGSMTPPGSVQYIQYVLRNVPAAGGLSGNTSDYARVVTMEQTINGSHIPGDMPIISEDSNLNPGNFANVFSTMPDAPTGNIPALQHYRLVHESPNGAIVIMFPGSSPKMNPDIKLIKIFEYVKGAHIPGNGIIEVPLVTNMGRTFVYRQESQGGEFVVPYSTSGNPYDVRASGPYHIDGTDQYINVTENDVMQGNRILA
jgi:dolichyl-diphosphooligosaccharide--protein glycosyltransferase